MSDNKHKVRHIRGPRPDPHPDIAAAGSANLADPTNNTKLCFDWGHHAPYTKRSLLDPIQHMPGKLAPNVVAVSEKARALTHGVVGDHTHSAGEVIFPPRQNSILAEREARREAIYHRKEHQVLGRSIIKECTLPEYTNDPDFRFGMASTEEDPVSAIITPNRDKEEENDAELYHRQYLLSHRSYFPGERRMHYGPDWSVPKYADNVVKNRLDNDGGRVRDSLFWEEERVQKLKNKLVSSRLADFRERRQPELGKVHDPIKSTIAHLPAEHTFGISFPADEYSIGELLGNTRPITTAQVPKDKAKLPPAGLSTHHHDDLDQQKHIIPKINDNEDKSIVLKITEDIVGGIPKATKMKRWFDLNHVFGVPTVRDPHGRMVKKKLADTTNYGDELGANGLMYPTPRNVYGLEQLRYYEKILSHAKNTTHVTAV